jgi:hypothetical protein
MVLPAGATNVLIPSKGGNRRALAIWTLARLSLGDRGSTRSEARQSFTGFWHPTRATINEPRLRETER